MMILAVVVIVLMLAAMALATVVQMCFLESMRLRPTDYEALRSFETAVQPVIGARRDAGALAFSLWKHSLLALIAVPVFVLAESPWEAAIYSFLLMLGAAYLIPQFLYRRSTGMWMVRLVPLFRFMIFAARPLISFLTAIKTVAEIAGDDEVKEDSSEQEIQALIDAGAEEGLIEEGDKKLIKTVIEFGDKTVREVMTARRNIVAISEDKTLEDLRQLLINEKYSRIPVYRGTLDNVVGFVHVRDIFEADYPQRSKRKVKEIMREIDAVPESKPVDLLFREMQRDGKHMVQVVDEYGQTAGIATMEDLVEEIFGEIRDEHEPTLDVQKDPDGSFVVSGSYDVDHLNELVEFRPGESTEATTIGGLVTEWMGHVPLAGESIERDGIRIDVLAASDLRVDRVRLSRIPVGRNGANGDV